MPVFPLPAPFKLFRSALSVSKRRHTLCKSFKEWSGTDFRSSVPSRSRTFGARPHAILRDAVGVLRLAARERALGARLCELRLDDVTESARAHSYY